MTNTPNGVQERLDSWKAIADYLGRDVRTVRRWEKDNALPVRRLPGARGHSVFAYTSEIDDWLKSAGSNGASALAETVAEPAGTGVPDSDHVGATPAHEPRQRLWVIMTAAAVVIVAVFGWRTLSGARSAQDPLRVRATDEAVIAATPAGEERWRYPFAADEITAFPVATQNDPVAVLGGTSSEVLVAIAHRIHRGDDRPLDGRVLAFDLRGQLQRTFSFDDRVTFGGTVYEAPWAITHMEVGESVGRRQTAVSAHHYRWWPGLVTVLDDQFHRRGTFVNGGWIEYMRWLSPDRLVISGFSDGEDAAIVALLDPNAMDGRSPEKAGSKFLCESCPATGPLRYITLPRSELNGRTVSPFNRASIDLEGGSVIVHTIEIPSFADGAAIDAVYEFSPALELRSAKFEDRYWQVHRTFEIQGRLNHTRDQCPEKDGPVGMKIWEPATGWRPLTVTPRK